MSIVTAIKALFVRAEQKTVASITAHLHDTVEALEAHIQDMAAKAKEKADAAARALKERLEHEEEAIKASKVAQNIKALLS